MKGNITNEMTEKNNGSWEATMNNIQQQIEDIEEMDTFLETYNF